VFRSEKEPTEILQECFEGATNKPSRKQKHRRCIFRGLNAQNADYVYVLRQPSRIFCAEDSSLEVFAYSPITVFKELISGKELK
jgi:hypothetical protein